MAHQKATPIIVGVGDVINRSRKVEDAIEPLQLMLQAIELALHDTKLPPDAERALQASIDSLDVIRTWTWPYADLPELLSGKLGIKPKHTYYSLQSGREIGKVLDEAARSISFGDAKVALITGGEALASRRQARSYFLIHTWSEPFSCWSDQWSILKRIRSVLTRCLSASDRLYSCQEASSSWLDTGGAADCLCAFSHRGKNEAKYVEVPVGGSDHRNILTKLLLLQWPK